MRKDVYESEAVERDDDDPFVPRGSEEGRSRTINWDAFSHAFMPVFLRNRAIEVSVRTDKSAYEVDETVRFRVKLRNRIPFPVLLRTASPVMWRWAIDGLQKASKVPEPDPPREKHLLRFHRSETKTFTRRWSQQIQVEADRWEAVEPGEYTLSAWINVPDAEKRTLYAETPVEIR